MFVEEIFLRIYFNVLFRCNWCFLREVRKIGIQNTFFDVIVLPDHSARVYFEFEIGDTEYTVDEGFVELGENEVDSLECLVYEF